MDEAKQNSMNFHQQKPIEHIWERGKPRNLREGRQAINRQKKKIHQETSPHLPPSQIPEVNEKYQKALTQIAQC